MFRTTLAVLLFATLLLPGSAILASSGTVNSDGTINIRLNLRFPPTATQLATLQNRITAMSHLIYDATEGQLRLGTVTMDCSNTTADLADYWVVAEGIRSGTGIDVLGVPGAHITEYFDDSGSVYAHEFGHLGFGLGDEYEEDATTCWGKGVCISETPDQTSAQNQCLMQQSPGRDWTEFCVTGNHDPLKGNNTTCLVGGADGAPCMENCQSWNTTTHKVESSQQEQISHQSCWQKLTAKFPFLTAPALPAVAEPALWVAPTFTMTCASASTLMLVLDRSGSMSWNVNDDGGEVCGNGVDDDGDGTTDESDCAQARIQFVRAAGRSVLQLASTDAMVRAGILSFASTPSAAPDAAIQNVSMNLASMKGTVDGLMPGGETAIGDALASAKTTLDADSAAAASKAVVIITDGVNTTGSAADSAVPAYVAAGIRIFTISTGGASNSATLSAISSNTRGYRVDEPDGTALVTALAELWAFYTNGGVIFPQTPFAVVRGAEGKSIPLQPRVGVLRELSRQVIGDQNVIEFDVESGTRNFTALLAGNMNDMTGFGVRARLVAPDATVFDAESPPAGMTVAFDPYFTFVRIADPTPGRWQMIVRARATAAPVQTGTLIVISDNPRTFLYADVDHDVVSAAGETVKATILPGYVTGLREPALNVRVKRPNGSVVAVPVTRTAQPFVFEARLDTFPNRGLYELIVDMQTTSATTNDPGESRPGTLAPASVPIPPIQRSVSTFFFVNFGPWSCNEPDCDHDGIPNESSTTDADGDGIVTSNDNDDNNDEIPDRRQTGGSGFDRRRLLFGGAVGSSHPLGKLNGIADANIYAKLDLDYALTSAVHARLMAGIAQFTAQPSLTIDHPRYHHISLNAQFLAPISAATRVYLAGGPGWYRPESGSSSAGGNIGAGFRIGAASGNVLELGLDYHRAGDDRRGQFLAWHLGILFR